MFGHCGVLNSVVRFVWLQDLSRKWLRETYRYLSLINVRRKKTRRFGREGHL